MLFGEYTIIQGSMGLTIPYAHFNGELRMINKHAYTDLNFAVRSNQELQKYAGYLRNLQQQNLLTPEFDADRMQADLKKGLYFESTIPEGYGLGSSGALVAALYSRYIRPEAMPHAGLLPHEILRLKHDFAQMESFFHGTSSGIDPLICYLKHPIHLENKHTIRPISIPRKKILPHDAIFLINTGQAGKTQPLVKRYLEKFSQPQFAAMIAHELIPLTNACIQTLLSGHIHDCIDHIHRLSTLQIEYFREMIPDRIVPAWLQGLQTRTYTLKLCGSGGGGYMLGFTRNYPQTVEELAALNLDTIPVYSQNVSLKSNP